MSVFQIERIRERFTAAVQAFAEPESVQASSTEALTGPGVVSGDGRGNRFTSYRSQVERGWTCWRNRAQYGNLPVRAVLRFWRTWIAGNGTNISGTTENETRYIADFLEGSPFDSTLIKKIALGYLIEGRALLILTSGEKVSEVRYLKWIDYRYRLIRDPLDRSRILYVEFADSNGTQFQIPENEFVYVSEDDDEDEPPPPLAPVLMPALHMEQAKADWRDMNHHWGSLGINWETTGTEALKHSRYIARWLDAKQGKWELGDTTAFPARGTFPEPSGNGQESIKKEIDMDARFISGYSGIGIHLLGWASEMSNRATASELDEARVAAISDIRDRLEGFARVTVLRCYRRDTLRNGSIEASLPPVASHQVKEVIEIWVPLEQGGYVTRDEVIDRIPGIDPAQRRKAGTAGSRRSAQERRGQCPIDPRSSRNGGRRMKAYFQVQAAREILSPDEMLKIVGPQRIEHLKQKYRDPHPFFKSWVMLQEGDAEVMVIGKNGQKERRPVFWPREAIESSIRNLPQALKFWNRHNRDNSTTGRREYGEKIADVHREIDGKLTAITIGYFPPGHERETAQKSDIISFEGDLTFADRMRKVVEGIGKYTGIALGRSSSERPGFPGSFEVASVQAFVYDENTDMNERSEKQTPERTSMSFDPSSIDFKDLMESLDYRTLKKAFAYRKMRLHDFIDPADATGDLIWNEEAGTFGWVGGDEADHKLQEHILRNVLAPATKKITELQKVIADSNSKLAAANKTIFANSARPMLEKLAEAEGFDEVVLKLAEKNLDRLDVPERADGMSEVVWEATRDKALKRHLESALAERKKLEELGAVFGETEKQPGEGRSSDAGRNQPALGRPPGEAGNENPLVSYAQEAG